jgi:hypothetical protein
MDYHIRHFVALVGNCTKPGEIGPAENVLVEDMPAEDKPTGGTATC